jgi:hypothetical protein
VDDESKSYDKKIACELGYPILWDPATQSFVNDPEGVAAAMLHYKYREPYKL